MSKGNQDFTKETEKYFRLFKRKWIKAYKQRVKITEKELGGELYAC